jgi:hypothetical protein
MKTEILVDVFREIIAGFFVLAAIYYSHYLKKKRKEPIKPTEHSRDVVTAYGTFFNPTTLEQRKKAFHRREYLSGFGLLLISAFQMFITPSEVTKYFIIPISILFIASVSWMLKKYILTVILGVPSLAAILFYWIFM